MGHYIKAIIGIFGGVLVAVSLGNQIFIAVVLIGGDIAQGVGYLGSQAPAAGAGPVSWTG